MREAGSSAARWQGSGDPGMVDCNGLDIGAGVNEQAVDHANKDEQVGLRQLVQTDGDSIVFQFSSGPCC